MTSRQVLQLFARCPSIARQAFKGINPVKIHRAAVNYRLTNLGFPRQHSQTLSTTSALTCASDRVSKDDVRKSIDRLTEKFMEAKELLEDARESVGTVYFSSDMTEAQEAVSETLSQYEDLLRTLSEEQRQDVVRTIGLKMEELKAQEQAIKEVEE